MDKFAGACEEDCDLSNPSHFLYLQSNGLIRLENVLVCRQHKRHPQTHEPMSGMKPTYILPLLVACPDLVQLKFKTYAVPYLKTALQLQGQ